MFKKIKALLTHETWNSFEPVVMLPAWKSVIVESGVNYLCQG